jgi:hypothetical protein
MAVLSRLWFAMRTRNIEDAGTDDRIQLIIKEDGVEKLIFTVHDSSQDDQERGKANLYQIGSIVLRPENLTDSSFNVAIKGKDFWFPEHVLIWAEADKQVVPLAAEWDIEAGISTDPNEGRSSFPVRRIGYPTSTIIQAPDSQARIRQLLVILTTANVEDAGTPDDVVIKITLSGGRKQNPIHIRTSSMKELKRGQAFFSLPSTEVPVLPGTTVPRWNNLESVDLEIEGDEAWLPGSFSLFGFTGPYGDPDPQGTPKGPRPRSIMPLIHIPKWNLGKLSKDRDEGKPSVSLPLLPIPTFQPFSVNAPRPKAS